MHLRVDLGEPGEIDIVAVAGAQDADAPAALAGDDQPFQCLPVRRIQLPLAAGGAVELGLLVFEQNRRRLQETESAF